MEGPAAPTSATKNRVVEHAWVVVTVGAFVAATALAIAVFWPHVYGATSGLNPPEQAKQLADDRDFGLKLATGAGALAAALLAWGRFEMAKQQADLDRSKADIDRAKADVDRARLDSDRFTTAVENFADPREAVALGGVYALQDLANNSSAYQIPVTNVLCAYVRNSTQDRVATEGEGQLVAVSDGDGRTRRFEEAWLTIRPFHEVELATIGVLEGRQLWDGRINLQGAKLARLTLALADWSAANLQESDLRGATLSNVNLTNANLQAADLSYVDLRETELAEGNLSWATVTHTWFPESVWKEVRRMKVNTGSTVVIDPRLDSGNAHARPTTPPPGVWDFGRTDVGPTDES